MASKASERILVLELLIASHSWEKEGTPQNVSMLGLTISTVGSAGDVVSRKRGSAEIRGKLKLAQWKTQQ